MRFVLRQVAVRARVRLRASVRRQYRARCVDARLERQREANEKCLKMLPVLLGGVVLLVLLGYYFSLPATETAGEPAEAADSEP